MKIVLMILLAIAILILIASVLLQSGNSAGLSGYIAVLFIVLSLVIVTME